MCSPGTVRIADACHSTIANCDKQCIVRCDVTRTMCDADNNSEFGKGGPMNPLRTFCSIFAFTVMVLAAFNMNVGDAHAGWAQIGDADLAHSATTQGSPG